MPAVDDYDPDDESDALSAGGGGGRAAPGGGGGGPSAAGPSAQKEGAFVPWSRFVNANEGVATREANKLQSGVQGQVDRAQSGLADASNTQREAINSNYAGYRPPTKPNTGGRGGFSQPSSFSTPQPGAFGEQNVATPSLGASQTAPPPPGPDKKRTPWDSFQSKAPELSRAAGVVDNGRLQTDLSTLDAAAGRPSTTTANSALTGAKDLEGQVGSDAWSKLMGDTVGAQSAANSLGSNEGVQALLQQQGARPATGFDSALLSGAGTGFGDVAQKYGGSKLTGALAGANTDAQNRWAKLQGDVKKTGAGVDQAILDANKNIDPNAKPDAAPDAAPVASTTPQDGSGWHPDGTTDLNSFLTGGDARDAASAVGMGLSPLDQIWQSIPGLGSESISQKGANYFTGGGAGHPENITRQALSSVSASYGKEAAEYLWNHMTPDMWKQYLSENLVDQRTNMEAWLESAGFKRKGPEAKAAVTNSDGRQVSAATPGATKTSDERIADYDAADPGWSHNVDGRRTTAKQTSAPAANEEDNWNHDRFGRRTTRKAG